MRSHVTRALGFSLQRCAFDAHAVLWLALVSCAVDPEPELSTETSELATCVPYVGHWWFWGECSGDVPLAAGSPVYSLSSGQVTQV